MLRLLEHFKTDLPDNRRPVKAHVFLCPAQQQLLINDTARLLVYKDVIPRRELVQYLISLFSFHAALYCMRSFSLILKLVETKNIAARNAKGLRPTHFTSSVNVSIMPEFLLTSQTVRTRPATRLAKRNVAKHYGVMFRYFRAQYILKKLDEFAQTFPGYHGTVEEAIAFAGHKDLDGYFRTRLAEVTKVEDEAEQDPEIRAILDLKLAPLDAYAEILLQKTFKTRSRNHKALMASLCGLNRDDGFLHGGRGKKRKYVLGNQLLELLVQLAVVGRKPGRFVTEPITVSDFVSWIRTRYGILIDSTGEENDSPDIARALEVNYTALKDRLRQLGFFTDLSDASISQVIKPRFPITASPDNTMKKQQAEIEIEEGKIVDFIDGKARVDNELEQIRQNFERTLIEEYRFDKADIWRRRAYQSSRRIEDHYAQACAGRVSRGRQGQGAE